MKNPLKPLFTTLVLLLFFSSCKNTNKELVLSNSNIEKNSKALNDWFEAQFQTELSHSPMFQTRLGIKNDYGKWDDISPKADAAKLERRKKCLNYINTIDINTLDKATQLSYKLYKQQLEAGIYDYKYRLYYYPVNQMFGTQSRTPAFLINMHQISDKSDALAYISRLQKLKPYFNQLIENLKEREAAGIVPPKFVFPRVIGDSENILKGKPFDNSNNNSTLFKDFLDKIAKLNLPEENSKKLMEAAKEALLNSVKPAYQNLIAFLKEQEKRATKDHGVWKFKDGEAFYNIALKRTTTTNMTADEIHNLGLKEVKRIHNEMKVIMKQVGFNGTLQAFFAFMKNDPQFYFEDTEKGRQDYLTQAETFINTMKSRLDELFITKPKADLQVKAVEPFREKSAGKAFYQQPAVDGSRPGTYYANLYDMPSMPSYQMEALAYHEGIPGHHMQIAIQQELEDIPKFRKFARYTAYSEGWGLYTEFLPKELGFYSDPYSDFGRLAMELWRACRLVVDTGIHAKKWTREQGIDYYVTNTPNAKADAVKMVERHIVMPSQATAYKIGMNKIIELREDAKNKLGDKFDIREFHEIILGNGPVPLNILEEFINQWIKNKADLKT